MAAAIGLTGDWLESVGSKRAVNFTLTGDNSYPTGGYTVTAAQVGLGVVDNWQFQASGGFVCEYVAATGKVKFYADGGNLPSVTVVGGAAGTIPLTMSPDSNAGVLGKTAATTRTIPGATFGFVSAAGALVEVAATTDLHLAVIQGRATGR